MNLSDELYGLNPRKFIEVEPFALTTETITGTSVSGPNVEDAFSMKYAELRRRLLEHQIQPSHRITVVLELAKDIVLDYLGKDSDEYKKMMGVVFLSRANYTKVFGAGSRACAFVGSPDVYVYYDTSVPEYQLAVFAFHELVHSWIDKHLEVFAITAKQEYLIEERRVGSQILKIVRNAITGTVEKGTYINVFLNELGNVALQRIFLRELLETPEIADLFKDEIVSHDQNLGVFYDDLSGYATFLVKDHVVKSRRKYVRIAVKNIFVNNAGKFSVSNIELMTQLIDDISEGISEISDIDFTQALLQLKREPRGQSQLMKVLDTKFGPGFYKRLRETNYHSQEGIAQLLLDVQEKLSEV